MSEKLTREKINLKVKFFPSCSNCRYIEIIPTSQGLSSWCKKSKQPELPFGVIFESPRLCGTSNVCSAWSPNRRSFRIAVLRWIEETKRLNNERNNIEEKELQIGK